jgi:hypothetical protein
MRRTLFIVASVLVSVAVLYVVLRDIPLVLVGQELQRANPLWLVLAFIGVNLSMWTRVFRWQGLLPSHSIPHREACGIIGITFTLNLLPLRAGEIARSFLAMRYGVPFVTAATSVVVERLTDTLLVVVLLTLALTQVPDVPPETQRVAALFGMGVVLGFGVLIFFARFPHIPRTLLQTVFRVVPLVQRLIGAWLERTLEHLLSGLEPLTHWRLAAGTLLWTVIAWIPSFFTLYFTHLAFDLDPSINIVLSSLLGLTLASFSIAIPVTVASIGPLEAALVVTGVMVGMAEPTAFAVGLLFHAVSVLGYLAWGVAGFVILGIKPQELLQQAEKRKGEA